MPHSPTLRRAQTQVVGPASFLCHLIVIAPAPLASAPERPRRGRRLSRPAALEMANQSDWCRTPTFQQSRGGCCQITRVRNLLFVRFCLSLEGKDGTAWTPQKSRARHLRILCIQDQQLATLAGGEGALQYALQTKNVRSSSRRGYRHGYRLSTEEPRWIHAALTHMHVWPWGYTSSSRTGHGQSHVFVLPQM